MKSVLEQAAILAAEDAGQVSRGWQALAQALTRAGWPTSRQAVHAWHTRGRVPPEWQDRIEEVLGGRVMFEEQ